MSTATHEDAESDVIGIDGARKFCKALTKEGKRCRAIPLEDGYCFAHSPALAEKRREGQSQGGQAVAERRKLLVGQIDFSSGEAVRRFFESLTRAVLRGELPASRAKAAADIASAALSVRRGQEVEDRLDELERLLHQLEEARSEAT